MTAPVGYTPPINPQTNEPYTPAELQAFLDTIEQAAEAVEPQVFNSSGQVILQLPADTSTGLSLNTYLTTLSTARDALEQFLKQVDAANPIQQEKFAYATALEIQNLAQLEGQVFNFNTLYQNMETSVNSMIPYLNGINQNYNNTVPAQQALYVAMANYNAAVASGNSSSIASATTAYETAATNYNNQLSTLTSDVTAYNSDVTDPTVQSEISTANSQIESINNVIDFINSINGSVIINDVPSVGNFPTYTLPPQAPSSPTYPMTFSYSVNGVTMSIQPTSSAGEPQTIPTISTLTQSTLGNYDNVLNFIRNQMLVTQDVGRLYSFLNANTQTQTNLLAGIFFFKPVPYAYIKQNTHPLKNPTPKAFPTLTANSNSSDTQTAKLELIQLIEKAILNLDQIITSLLTANSGIKTEGSSPSTNPPTNIPTNNSATGTQSSSSATNPTTTNVLPTQLAAFFLSLLKKDALGAALTTVQTLNKTFLNPSQTAADITFLTTFVNQLISQFGSSANLSGISALLQANFPTLSGDDLQNVSQAIQQVLNQLALLTASLVLGNALGIPQANILQNIQGVPQQDLITALQGNPPTASSILNDPLKQTIILANLFQIIAPTTSLAPTAAKEAINQAVTTLANQTNINLQTATQAFLQGGFSQNEADILGKAFDLLVQNNILNPNLNTTLNVSNQATPEATASFLSQYTPEEQSVISTNLNWSLQQNPQSLQSFSVDFQRRLTQAGFSPLESLQMAQSAANAFQPAPSPLQSALSQYTPGVVNPALASVGTPNPNAASELAAQTLSSTPLSGTEKPILTQYLTNSFNAIIQGLSQSLQQSPNQQAALDAIKTFTTPSFELNQVPFNSITAASAIISLGVPNLSEPVKASVDSPLGIGLPRA